MRMKKIALKKVSIVLFVVVSMFLRVDVGAKVISQVPNDIKVINTYDKNEVNTKAIVDWYSSKYICSYDVGLRQTSEGLEVNASILCISKMDSISISVALMEKRGGNWYRVKTLSTSSTARSECVMSKPFIAVNGRAYKAVVTYTVGSGNDVETRSLESSEKVYYK